MVVCWPVHVCLSSVPPRNVICEERATVVQWGEVGERLPDGTRAEYDLVARIKSGGP